MSTYAPDPYVFAQIDPPVFNNCSSLDGFIQKVKNTFIEGGWDVEDIGPRLIVTTDLTDSGFPLCILGTDEISFYRVTLTGTGFYGIVDEDAIGDCVTDCVIDRYIKIPAQTDRTAVHNAIKAAIAVLYAEAGINAYPLPTETIGTDLVSEIVLSVGDNCSAGVTIGNQLVSSVSQGEGAGFIARSQEAITDGNRVEVYCTYDPGAGSSFARMYYRIGGWTSRSLVLDAPSELTVFCPDDQLEYITATASADHPLTIRDDELNVSLIDAGLTDTTNPTIQGIDLWVNPYGFVLDPTVAATGISTRIFCSALKIKALEGEVLETDSGYPDDLNMQASRIFISRGGGGTSFREEMQMQHVDTIVEFDGNGFDEKKIITVTHGTWGPLIICGIAETINYEQHGDGIVWNGGIATIAEPWCAVNFVDPGVGNFAPIIAQLWDAILPYRSINKGINTHVINDVFPWDGQLWRYYQVDREGVGHSGDPGPPCSLSYRVLDGRIFDGDNYDGASLATLVEISAVFAADVVTLTITIQAAPSNGGMVWIRSIDDDRIQIPNPIILFSSGETVQVVELDVIDLEIEETVVIRAKGVNTRDTSVTVN